MSEARWPTCRKCGGKDWLVIPDSLAIACKVCLAVLVLGGENQGEDGYSEGASLAQWAEDVYGDDNGGKT